MNNKFLTGIVIATAAIAGSIAQASSASAFTWDNSWVTPLPKVSGASVGFDHKPFQQFVNQERLAIPGSNQQAVNIADLYLKYDYNVKVSFINEGAKSRDSLAFRAKSTNVGGTNASGLLFKDLSCKGTYDGGTCSFFSNNDPENHKFGDTVKLGMLKAGSLLDFGLKKGTSGNVYGLKAAENPDSLEHAIAYIRNGLLMVGFENQYGGLNASGGLNERSDRDFNDAVFVLDIGEKNIACLQKGDCRKTPEPAAAIGLISMGAAALIKRRRHG